MARSRYDGIIIHDMRGSIANLTAWQMPTWQTGDLPYFPSWHTAFGPGGYRTGQQLARAKKHFPDPGRTMWYRWNSCECMAYAVADYLWIENLIDRRLWSRNVKKPGINGYALWIKEATAAARQGLYLPDYPSKSGGYSTDKIVPGHTWQPPADCIKPPSDRWDRPCGFIPWNDFQPYPRCYVYLSNTITPFPDWTCEYSLARWWHDPQEPLRSIEAQGPGNPLWLVSPDYHGALKRVLHIQYTWHNGYRLTYEYAPQPSGYWFIPTDAVTIENGIWLARGPWK